MQVGRIGHKAINKESPPSRYIVTGAYIHDTGFEVLTRDLSLACIFFFLSSDLIYVRRFQESSNLEREIVFQGFK